MKHGSKLFCKLCGCIQLVCFFSIGMFFISSHAHGDMLAIIINENALPYALNQYNYNNSNSNYNNSYMNYDNSVNNYNNSPNNYDNSSFNYQNSINGQRRIISTNNIFIGYYVFAQHGVINIFSVKGDRVAYIPSDGHTQSIFMSEGGWGGTIVNLNGQLVFGFSQQCYLRLLH